MNIPYSSDSAAPTRATITLINHDNPEKSYSKEFNHNYSNSSTDWGYSSFMKLRDLTNPAKGFIVNDSIVLKAEIEVQQQAQRSTSGELARQNSVLTCPGCDCDYDTQGGKKPMSLRCGHTFCSDCLDKKCNNYTSDSPVTITCSVCEQEHSGGSTRELWFPNHAVMQMIGNFIPKSKYFCESHKQNMDYYCFVDSCLVCIGCAYQGKHAGHECKLVSDAKMEVEKQLTLTVKKVVSKSTEISSKLDLFKDEQKSLRSQEDGLVQVIEQSYRELEELIKKRKDSQLRELKEHMEELNSSVETNVRSTEEKGSQVLSALTEYEAWKALSAKDALLKLGTLNTTLKTAESIPTGTKSSANLHTSISFINPMSELFAYIENHGRLDVIGSQGSVENNHQANLASGDSDGKNVHTPPNKRKKYSQ
ncbi:tripartite motif-containing protein 12A-like isoform X3 [Halichondria panicea]|uniref:tripartite motif-containing protein 12A-like isoform X3 n=1 Tax=Halichondria panicea TaxID=6063 RepID=UPI00312B4D63